MKYKNREWLCKQKMELKRTTKSIAKECGVDSSTINKWMRRFDIEASRIRPEFVLKCDDCGDDYNSRGRKKSNDGKFRCKKCQRKIHNAKSKNKRKQKEYNQSKKGKLKRREWRLKTQYGLSLGDYEKILNKQNRVCAICKNTGDLVVDHSHLSGKVRGLLCDGCNRALGIFKDNPIALQNAILYLIRSEEDNSWDRYFINIAALVSTRSKDPSTQVGAVLVRDKVILSTGYNGFPRGCDDFVEERYERPLKYEWTVHAEENALLNAGRQGISVLDSTLYVTPLHPCAKCMRTIIQCGVRKIVCQPVINPDRWAQDFEIARQMLKESNIQYVELI